jgi:hypothetical protein
MLDSEQTILAAAKRDSRKYYFMICDICFWCASVFGPDLSKYHHDAFLCPVCEGVKVHAVPLASDEVYGSKVQQKQQGDIGVLF